MDEIITWICRGTLGVDAIRFLCLFDQELGSYSILWDMEYVVLCGWEFLMEHHYHMNIIYTNYYIERSNVVEYVIKISYALCTSLWRYMCVCVSP